MIDVMMNRLLWMSVVGGLVILAVLVIRVFLKRAPKLFSYLLWLVVLFRLLCPLAWASDFSFIELGQRAASFLPDYVAVERAAEDTNGKMIARNDAFAVIGQFVSEGAAADGLKHEDNGKAIPQSGEGDGDAKWTEHRSVGIPVEAAPVLAAIWLVGAGAMLGYSAQRESRLRHFLTGARRERDNIYVKSGIDTSFVVGFFRPRIYVPEGMEGQELKYVLLHEQTHIQRGDVLYRRLFYLALVLHWFNPLVWAAFSLCMRDMEMACDEAVVRKLGEEIKRDYSNSLLAMATGERNTLTSPLAFGGGDTKSRIRNVLSCRRIRPVTAVFCAFVLVAAALVFATNPRFAGGEEDSLAANVPETEAGTFLAPDLQEMFTGGIVGSTEATEAEINADILNSFEVGVLVKSVARSAREIDLCSMLEPPEGLRLEDIDRLSELVENGLAFAEDCRFYINYNVEAYQPQEVDFDDFAAQIEKDDAHVGQPCYVVFSEGLVHEITLLGTHSMYGLSYAPFYGSWTSAEGLNELVDYAGEGALEQYYTLLNTTELDVADGAEPETIEVYTGDSGHGEDGVLLISDAAGALRYSAHTYWARASWKNIYAGRLDGGGEGFLLILYLEDREIFGYYEYQVFRLKADGAGIEQIAGSSFTWGEGTGCRYDADEFVIWCHNLGHYLEDSRLLLGMQYGKLRTERVCDRDRYCYRTLVPSCYEDPYEGQDIR